MYSSVGAVFCRIPGRWGSGHRQISQVHQLAVVFPSCCFAFQYIAYEGCISSNVGRHIFHCSGEHYWCSLQPSWNCERRAHEMSTARPKSQRFSFKFGQRIPTCSSLQQLSIIAVVVSRRKKSSFTAAKAANKSCGLNNLLDHQSQVLGAFQPQPASKPLH